MASGRPSPPCAGEYRCARRTARADTLGAPRARNRNTLREFAVTDCGDFVHSAAAVSADAHGAAESSRDVSDPTSGLGTLTPGSVTGSLTSRLRV
jgi:hypothetical protein